MKENYLLKKENKGLQTENEALKMLVTELYEELSKPQQPQVKIIEKKIPVEKIVEVEVEKVVEKDCDCDDKGEFRKIVAEAIKKSLRHKIDTKA